MYPPIRVSWLLDRLPVESGDRLALLPIPTGGRYNSQPVPTEVPTGGEYASQLVPADGELVLLSKPVGNEPVPLHKILVDDEHTPPLVLAGHTPGLPPVPAVDVRLLRFAVAGRIRGLLLAGVGNEHVLWPVMTTEEYNFLPVLCCRGDIPPSASAGCGGMSLYIENDFLWTHSTTLADLLSSI